MSESSDKRSAEFLKISGQFKLGDLVTESSHPVTASLSEVAKQDVSRALDLLFQADQDVLAKFGEFVESGRASQIKQTLLDALRKGGKVFFTGCGSTGRLSILLVSIWRDFWQQQRRHQDVQAAGSSPAVSAEDLENRAYSVMAGGDFALIKSVEGFEDFTEFGKRQIGDLGVSAGDVVFAITEGGETSFVIGTAWKGVEAGAKVYFVYNNPDDILCRRVERSREVIEDGRIEKINLTTGPMSITGSTRMQATTIQLCVLLTVLEMVVRELVAESPANRRAGGGGLKSDSAPREFLAGLDRMHSALRSKVVLSGLARVVALEESVYRAGHKNNYYADRLGIDVLTDTTERSPTYCTPPFRKFDDAQAAESWSFLFLPDANTPDAWERILKRKPDCVDWSETTVRQLVGAETADRTCATVRWISREELMRFKIGLDGLPFRKLEAGDSAVGIIVGDELVSQLSPGGFQKLQLEAAGKAGAKLGAVCFGGREALDELRVETLGLDCLVPVPVPETGLLLDGVTRAGAKMLLNALSTCTMVRLGRVMGNTMVWVVPSNLKLIDRSTRYLQRLAGLTYEQANRLLFEVIEYVEPRMKADQAYPPVVGLAVLRAREQLTNEAAEQHLSADPAGAAG